MKIKLDKIFETAPEPAGMHWRNFCMMENDLATRLLDHPGMMVQYETDVWYLVEADEEEETMALAHAFFDGCELNDESTRFHFGLEWVDIDPMEIEYMNKRMQNALLYFDSYLVPLPEQTTEETP